MARLHAALAVVLAVFVGVVAVVMASRVDDPARFVTWPVVAVTALVSAFAGPAIAEEATELAKRSKLIPGSKIKPRSLAGNRLKANSEPRCSKALIAARKPSGDCGGGPIRSHNGRRAWRHVASPNQ